MSRQTESWERFCEEYIAKLPEDHTYIADKDKFAKMSSKWGFGFIDYIKSAYKVWDRDTMTEEEFKSYNGIPDSIFNKLNRR